ncbi:MAG: hypothetical protein E3K40_04760 [Candidatus Brocadia sp.]|nr:hypothetical protein [Candidatus Brocadia sp.]
MDRTKSGFVHRVIGRGVVQRQVLYLGELNDNQRAGWVRTIETLWGKKPKAKQLALFPDDRKELPILACETILVRLDSIELRRVHGSGAHAGWGYRCVVFWNWTPFGGRVCRQVARRQAG